MTEPRILFTDAAVRAGLVQSAQLLTEDFVDLATEIVRLAARIADGYVNPSCEEDTVGDAFRAELFEV